jgi:mono/diheme cytochrome c family protein
MTILLSCNDSPYMQGKRLYIANCANCHMEDGSGLTTLIPSLEKSSYLGKTEVACIIRNGLRDTIFKDTTYLLREMPAFKKFSATEITNIVNFVNHTWSPNFKETTIIEIENVLKGCL